jgi:hypothetical protein
MDSIGPVDADRDWQNLPKKIKKGRSIMFEMLEVLSGRQEASPVAWRPSETKN